MEGFWSEGIVVTSVVFASVVGASIAYFLLVKPSPSKSEEVKRSTTSPPVVKQVSPKPVNKPREIKEGTVPLKLLFGSQTGTAEEFSKTLAHESKQYNFDPEVVDLEKYTIEELQNEKLVVFLTATYGDGEPTDNAKDFFQALMAPELPSDYLSNVQFSVFGLGNKTYQHYNIVGRTIDKRLEELGAKRFYERGEGDDDGSLEQDFNAWKTKFWEHTSRAFNLSGVTEILLPDRTTKLEWVDKPLRASMDSNNSENNGYDPKRPVLVDVVLNKELHSANSDRSCRHIQLHIGELKYEPGDHVGVYPENSNAVVQEFAEVVGVEEQLDKVFVLKSLEEGKDKGKLVLGPLTLRVALKTTLDLTSAPRQTLLKQLLPYVTDPKEKEEFTLLVSSSNEGQEKYNHWIRKDERVLAEVLAHFKSCKPPLDHLLEILPRLQPRYYSISSSLKAYPEELHLTSVVVSYVTPTGRKHQGVCSTYLTTLTPDSGIRPRIFLRKSTFRLPKEPSIPIVMIGPGTGVAPFRGFIQERKHSGVVDSKKNVLFFGSRRRDVDFIYQEELDSHEKENLLTLILAFSRETTQKIYVQNKVYEHRDLILNFLDTVHIYICGDAKNMAKDVHNTLKKLLIEHLDKTEEESETYLKNLASSGRYMQDVW